MKRLNLTQGTPEWHAHRLQHFNASDAPAMLGCSPYTSRAELLRRLHTGLQQEVDAGTQRRFDDGHRFEALARPLAEEIIGEPLYPVVGSEGELSSSFDGLTMAEDIAFEHKTLNQELRECMEGEDESDRLPKAYRVQMEQQLLVSGAERVLFMATKWDGDTLAEKRHCWYASDPALRAEIVAGWKQFAEDLANYKAPAAVEKIVAESVEALPAPVVQVTGQIALQDNFKVFEQRLRLFLAERLIREPKTDQDFADLDVQIKAMKQAREALKAAEAQMLAQVQPVDQAKKTKDMLDDLLQKNVSMAEKLLKDEKERRRGEIVAVGVKALADHIATRNARLGKPYMPTIPADFGGCIKGKSSLAKMEDAVATELARAKIAANEAADRISVNLAALGEWLEFAHLFPDTAAIVAKAPDDCRALIDSRIAAHRAQEERRLEAERTRIRAEEEARAQRQQQEREAAERRQREEAEAAQRRQETEKLVAVEDARAAEVDRTFAAIAAPAQPAAGPAVIPMPTKAPAAPAAAPTLRLGQINQLIAPLSIDAAGLASLGFPPAATDKAAKLYHHADFARILFALVSHLQAVQVKDAA